MSEFLEEQRSPTRKYRICTRDDSLIRSFAGPAPRSTHLRQQYRIVYQSNQGQTHRQSPGPNPQLAAKDAVIRALWMLSEDRIQRVGAATSSSGYDYFEIANADRGDYTLVV